MLRRRDDTAKGTSQGSSSSSIVIDPDTSTELQGKGESQLGLNNNNNGVMPPAAGSPSLLLVEARGHHHSFYNIKTTNNKTRWTITLLILLVGIGASASFLAIGISAANNDQKRAVNTDLAELAWGIQAAFREYDSAALWLHQTCTSQKRLSNSSLIPRAFFREVYESMSSNGLPFHAAQFIPNVTHAERAMFEEEAVAYYNEYYPELPEYAGFSGFVNDTLTARSEQPFYFPVHYVEPVLDNVGVLDFDIYSEAYPQHAVNMALSTWKPVITGGLRLIQEFDPSPHVFSVLLMHPGIHTSTDLTRQPRDVSLLAVRIPSLFRYIADQQVDIPNLNFYLFDSTPDDPDIDPEQPIFLGGAYINGDDVVHHESTNSSNPHKPNYKHKHANLTDLPTIELKKVKEQSRQSGSIFMTNEIEIGLRWWTAVAVTVPGSYNPELTFAIVGGTLIFVVCTCLALWVFTTMRRAAHISRLKSQAQEEQSLLRIEHAKQAAAAERQLNEFIAHEVRNPLSAAMSACSFVSSAVQDLAVAVSPMTRTSFALPAIPEKVAHRPAPTTAPVSSQNESKPQPLFSIAASPEPCQNTPQNASKPQPLFSLAAASGAKLVHDDDSTTPTIAPLFALSSPATTGQQRKHHNQQEQEEQQQCQKEQKESIMADLHIIDSSLSMINELLRNMLDVQRASHHQLKIEKAPTDVLRDILEPVDAMLYRRGRTSVQVIMDCPENVFVVADKLRLKQVVLNLSRNSAKFVENGYIKFSVRIVNGSVQIWVEDTGPGIPEKKKTQLFAKFQESLDSLSQGTGLGLSLCKILVGLMGGDVWLDEAFDSGIEGQPGARFIIELNTPPLQLSDFDLMDESVAHHFNTTSARENNIESSRPTNMKIGGTGADQGATHGGLPENLKILFVDDDLVLRKLIVRGVRRIAPNWILKEAASGEAALRLVDDEPEEFDLIFMDNYMASAEKQLLGTEATQALRAKGVRSIICGLSANDMAPDFFAAGANAFVCKPLPAKQETLRQVLHELLLDPSKVEQATAGWDKPSSIVIKPS